MISASGTYITVSVDPGDVLYWYDLAVETPGFPKMFLRMVPAEELVPSLDEDDDGKTLPPEVDVLTVGSTSNPKFSGLFPESLGCTLITLGVPSPVLSSMRDLLALPAPLPSLLRPSMCAVDMADDPYSGRSKSAGIGAPTK